MKQCLNNLPMENIFKYRTVSEKKRYNNYWLYPSQSELVIMDYDGNYP